MNTDSSKIVLASFPRSGNTYVRNILSRVYQEASLGVIDIDDDILFKNGPVRFLKTHLPYQEFIARFNPYFSVCIIRDGRDAVVSGAHHRADIVAPGTDYSQTLEESIRAKGGSYFLGWSDNIASWIQPSTLFWRYEDLLDDPIVLLEQLRNYIHLPTPRPDQLPSFEDMKKGNEDYVPRDPVIGSDGLERERHALFFRRGRDGAWKEDMTERHHKLYWKYHGHMMEALGYHKDGGRVTREEFDQRISSIREHIPQRKKGFLSNIFR